MGYFTNLSRAVNLNQSAPAPQEPGAVPVQPAATMSAQPTTVTAAPPAADAPPAPEPVADRAQEAPVPDKPLALEPSTPKSDDTARQAHEAAEAKRKAEWEAKQAKKNAARQATLDHIAAMNGAELLEAAVGRVATDTERLTRRNLKEAVAEHISAKCREDVAFAQLVMDPDKSMANCFRYINRKAREYAEQEMKDNGIERTGVYGLDVPDGLVYQWAEDYFRDPDAKEDHEKEEKFVPRPYVGKSSAKSGTKPKAKKEPTKPKVVKPKPQADVDGQMSFMGVAG